MAMLAIFAVVTIYLFLYAARNYHYAEFYDHISKYLLQVFGLAVVVLINLYFEVYLHFKITEEGKDYKDPYL